jgi:hypothetical protein
MTETGRRMPGTLTTREYARAKAITNPNASPKFKVGDDDVALLAEYYYRTRARAEEDLRQIQSQLAEPAQGRIPNPKQASTIDEEPNAAKADREEISALGGKLAGKANAVKSLSELVYTSLPGYCLHQTQTLPASYFDLNQGTGALSYVGPVHDPVYAGSYATPIDAYVNADAARHAYWPRHVYWWHNSRNPTTPLSGSGTGSGNMRGPAGVGTTRSGAGTGVWSGSSPRSRR